MAMFGLASLCHNSIMRTIPVGKEGQTALVDDEDFPLLSRITWCLTSHGYAGNAKCYMHSLVLGFPKGGVIDHIDRNPLNNSKANLRVITHQRNLMNRGRQKNKLTSQFKGVCHRARRLSKPWMASIAKSEDGKQRSYFLGYFGTEEEAAHAYDLKAMELFGHYAVLNCPDP